MPKKKTHSKVMFAGSSNETYLDHTSGEVDLASKQDAHKFQKYMFSPEIDKNKNGPKIMCLNDFFTQAIKNTEPSTKKQVITGSHVICPKKGCGAVMDPLALFAHMKTHALEDKLDEDCI